jgi:hypothetical protein
MQKHPKMSQALIGPLCPFYGIVVTQPVQVSPYAFQRYLSKRALTSSTRTVKSYSLPCGCYLLVHYSGLRQLAAEPL